MNNQNNTTAGSLGEIIQRLMRERDLHPAELAARAGVSVKTVDACRGAASDGTMPGRFGLCSVVRAIHLRKAIAATDLWTLHELAGIRPEHFVGAEAGGQCLERAIGVRGDEPVYADVRLREVGRVLRQLRIDRALTEVMIAGSCLVLSEHVVIAVEGGDVSLSPWLVDVLVPAMLRAIHRVRLIDPSDTRFLDGLLNREPGHFAAFLSGRCVAEGGAA